MTTIMKGIDCAMEVSAAAAAEIKAAGYDFVCRYLVPSSMAWKDLTLEEAQNISAAGLKLLCVFETTADRVKGGAIAGTKDGKTARALAQAIRMPTIGYLYFAVDYEPTNADLDTIEAYLRAAAEAIGDYPIGVYGNCNVVEAMKARGVCVGFWQCYAWSYGKKSEHRNVYQYQNARTVAGIPVDLNEAYSTAGFWSYENESEDELDMTKDELLKVEGTGDAPSDWAKKATEKMKDLGVFHGDGQGNFGWQQPITREAVAVVLANFAEKMGL